MTYDSGDSDAFYVEFANDNEYKIKTNVYYARNEKVNKRTGGIAFRSISLWRARGMA